MTLAGKHCQQPIKIPHWNTCSCIKRENRNPAHTGNFLVWRLPTQASRREQVAVEMTASSDSQLVKCSLGAWPRRQLTAGHRHGQRQEAGLQEEGRHATSSPASRVRHPQAIIYLCSCCNGDRNPEGIMCSFRTQSFLVVVVVLLVEMMHSPLHHWAQKPSDKWPCKLRFLLLAVRIDLGKACIPEVCFQYQPCWHSSGKREQWEAEQPCTKQA